MINTTMDKMKTPGWFSEPKNIATTIIALSLAAGLTYGFLTFVLPWLVTVTWNLVNLVIGGVVLGFLLMIVSSKKFWRTLKYFSEFIANYTIGLAIELNPVRVSAKTRGFHASTKVQPVRVGDDEDDDQDEAASAL